EAGIGKTRLLEHALQDARERGMQVVSGRTEELERTGRLACWPPRSSAPAHRLTRGGRRLPRYLPRTGRPAPDHGDQRGQGPRNGDRGVPSTHSSRADGEPRPPSGRTSALAVAWAGMRPDRSLVRGPEGSHGEGDEQRGGDSERQQGAQVLTPGVAD